MRILKKPDLPKPDYDPPARYGACKSAYKTGSLPIGDDLVTGNRNMERLTEQLRTAVALTKELEDCLHRVFEIGGYGNDGKKTVDDQGQGGQGVE